jgi:pyruvate/2-oxoglutarate dehydrogenase complex dihydrolipoamide acyltransferase (E2) component
LRHTIKLSQLGETTQSVVILRWLVNVGEEVSSDQPIIEVETDKVDAEVTATVSGVLVEQLVDVDDEVVPGTRLFVIEDGSGDV